MSLIHFGIIQKPNPKEMVHNTFLLISTYDMQLNTIALKTHTYFGKKHDFLQSYGHVNTFKGFH